MKRILSLVVTILFIPIFISAAPLDFAGGVHNEYEYEEYVFITGEPIKFKGSYDETIKEKANEDTITYKFKLVSEDPSLKGRLDRTITYKVSKVPHVGLGQIIEQMDVDKYKETISIDKDKYVLKDYQFSKSDVVDIRAASDFYSGNIKGRKYYELGNGEEKVIIDITGGSVGYENFWGSTETKIIDNIIKVEVKDKNDSEESNEEEKKSWSGTYSFQVSDSLTKGLKYSDNDVNLSTIPGGYLKVTNGSMVAKYDYDLGSRKRGSISLNKSITPRLERLIVPKFRDVNGHWAEDAIKKLYSLNVFEDQRKEIFSPDTNMNRMEFAVAMMRASDIRVEIPDEKKSRRRKRNEPEEESYFRDVSVKDKDYNYIKSAVDKEIVKGLSRDDFGPDKPLTRAQAITMIVRALGFESKAPNPGYMTSFSDDRKIPNWAKDSIYMAKEIGLVTGDNNNRVNPDKYLSRAEASILIVRYLEFLEKDLQKDYRYNIVNFN